MTPEQFDQALDELGWKAVDFTRKAGLVPNTVWRWRKSLSPIPEWVSEYLSTVLEVHRMHARFVAPDRLGTDDDSSEGVGGGTIGQFSCTATQMDSSSELPFSPYVVINLNHWGRECADGAPLVSPNLMTEDEIDYHVRALKADLDVVGRRAKVALRRAAEQTKALVSTRANPAK